MSNTIQPQTSPYQVTGNKPAAPQPIPTEVKPDAPKQSHSDQLLIGQNIRSADDTQLIKLTPDDSKNDSKNVEKFVAGTLAGSIATTATVGFIVGQGLMARKAGITSVRPHPIMVMIARSKGKTAERVQNVVTPQLVKKSLPVMGAFVVGAGLTGGATGLLLHKKHGAVQALAGGAIASAAFAIATRKPTFNSAIFLLGAISGFAGGRAGRNIENGLTVGQAINPLPKLNPFGKNGVLSRDKF